MNTGDNATGGKQAMLINAIVGVYMALLGAVAFEDLSLDESLPGKSEYKLRA